jgi:hypothetical protein
MSDRQLVRIYEGDPVPDGWRVDRVFSETLESWIGTNMRRVWLVELVAEDAIPDPDTIEVIP